MQLEVSTSGELVWTSYRDASGNLIVELPNSRPTPRLADLSLAQGMVESARLQVRDETDGPLTQLVVRTTTEAEHFVAADGSRLVVDLTPVRHDSLPDGVVEDVQIASTDQLELEPSAPAAEATWADEAESRVASTPASGTVDAPYQAGPPEGNGASNMYGVDVDSLGDSTVVHVQGDGQFHYSTFTLKNPDRFVLDLSGVVNSANVTQVAVQDERVERVRLAQFKQQPDLVARVVVDLLQPIAPVIETTDAGMSLVFSGSASAGTLALEASSFAPADEPEAVEVAEDASGDAETSESEMVAADEYQSGVEPQMSASAETAAESMEEMAAVDEAAEMAPAAEIVEAPSAMAAPVPAVEEPEVPEPMAAPEPVAEYADEPAAEEAEVVWEEATDSSWTEPEPVTEAQVAAVMPEPEPAPAPEPWQESEEPSGMSEYGSDESEPLPEVSSITRAVNNPERTYDGEPITMSLKDSEIKDVLRTFAQLSGLNIVVQPGVSGSVTVELTEVPWDQALEQILKINSLDYELEGNIMRIAPIDQLRAEAEEQQRLRAAKALSIPLRTIVRRVSYAQASQVARVLSSGGGASIMSQRGSVVVDGRTNTLIIKELPNFIDSVIAIIEQLDIPEPQVMIEARIIETTKRFSRTLGIDWDFSGVSSAATGNTTGLQFPNNGTVDGGVQLLTGARNGFLDISLGNVLNTFTLDAVLQAAENEGLINILSAPKITTLNNEKASIQSGLQIPIQTIANNTVSVQFVNATLRLDVTPHVTAEGTVLMDINIQKREPQLAFAVVGASNAPIATKDAKTRVIVRDGGTTVIGGIYQVSSDQGEDRVPGLASIPILGHLFKNKRRDDENEELLIFITPRVVKL